MILRLKHVKRVRAKGQTYWYHRKTGERLPTDHEERAARGRASRQEHPRRASDV